MVSILTNFTGLETVPEQYCKAIILQLEKKKKTVPRAARPLSPSLLCCLVIAYCYSLGVLLTLLSCYLVTHRWTLERYLLMEWIRYLLEKEFVVTKQATNKIEESISECLSQLWLYKNYEPWRKSYGGWGWGEKLYTWLLKLLSSTDQKNHKLHLIRNVKLGKYWLHIMTYQCGSK